MSTMTEQKVFATVSAILMFIVFYQLLFATGFFGEVWNWWQVNAVIPTYEKPMELPALIVSLFVIPTMGIMILVMSAVLTFKVVEAGPN